jgi:hypothetical protein
MLTNLRNVGRISLLVERKNPQFLNFRKHQFRSISLWSRFPPFRRLPLLLGGSAASALAYAQYKVNGTSMCVLDLSGGAFATPQPFFISVVILLGSTFHLWMSSGVSYFDSSSRLYFKLDLCSQTTRHSLILKQLRIG